MTRIFIISHLFLYSIVSIISILKHNNSPEDVEALFQTLVSTSEAIEKQNKTIPEKAEEESIEADQENKSGNTTGKKEPAVAYDMQLQLLLENLTKNEKLNVGRQSF